MPLHLVVIELGVYHAHESEFMALEQLVRNLLARTPRSTVVLLRSLSAWYCDNRKHECATDERPHSAELAPQAACAHGQLRALAAHYGIAYIDQFTPLQQVAADRVDPRHERLRAAAAAAPPQTPLCFGVDPSRIGAAPGTRARDYESFARVPADAAPFIPSRTLDGSIHPNLLGMQLLADVLTHAVRLMDERRRGEPSRAVEGEGCGKGGCGRRGRPSRAVEAESHGQGGHLPRLPLPRWLPRPQLASLSNRRCHACYAFDVPSQHENASASAVRAREVSLYGIVGTSPLPPVSIVHRNGWEYVVDVGANGHVKRGLAATTPGSIVTLSIDSRPISACGQGGASPGAVGGSGQVEASGAALPPLIPMACQPYISLEYLASYEHMGMAEVSCVGGCSCTPRQPLVLDAAWRQNTSEPRSALLGVSAAKECLLRVRVRNETRSGEHRFKLIGLRVGEMDAPLLSPPFAPPPPSSQHGVDATHG